MRILWLLFILFHSLNTYSSIFGADNRTDMVNVKNKDLQEISRSVPALIKKSQLLSISDTHFAFKGYNLVEKLGFCPDEKFVKNQSLVANCSAFLIDEDVIATAAHCFYEGDEIKTDDYYIVFDYKADSLGNPPEVIEKSNVFEIKNIIKEEYEWVEFQDYAVVKMDRPVQNRRPLKLNRGQRVSVGTPLYIIGYPLGLPQKYQPNSFVTAVDINANSFRHELDTFSVNSGSGVFNAITNEIVGIHVRGTGFNYKKDKLKSCNRWQKGIPGKDWGEANFIDLIF